MSIELDVSRAPLGQIAATRLVDTVAAGDDRLERHYLEIKSDLDLTKKTDLAKIAKYILASANRSPELAATAFEGYGVMIIGVAPGEARGVPPVEPLDISKVVSAYLGAAGPNWDIVWVPVAHSDNEVLVIFVDPPREGQKPFVCRKDGDGLVDGRVYIRADGETREAKGDELDRLLERAAAQPAPDVAFDVAIGGCAYPIEVDEVQTLEAEIGRVTRHLLDALPKPEPEPDPTPEAARQSASSVVVGGSALGFKDLPGLSELSSAGLASMVNPQMGAVARAAADISKVRESAFSSLVSREPEHRTEEQYRSAVEKWEKKFREKWPSAIDTLSGHLLDGITIRLKNVTKTYFHDVELKIHLEGEVRGVDYFDDDRVRYSDLDLPTAPRVWGPTERSILGHGYPHQGVFLPSTQIAQPSYRSPLDWRNSGSVDLRLEVGELRPLQEYVFDDQELVLLLPSTHETPVIGTWDITARDHHEVYSGAIQVGVGDVVNLTEACQELLHVEI